jgi:hypothetical protein
MNTTTFATSLLVGSLAFCVTSCWTPAGKGRKAKEGYSAAVPVIAALDRFHEELNELVPLYLPAEALLLHGGIQPASSPRAASSAEGWDIRPRFGYHQDGDAYDLSFSYTGPGMNQCWYDSKTKKWGAGGYY